MKEDLIKFLSQLLGQTVIQRQPDTMWSTHAPPLTDLKSVCTLIFIQNACDRPEHDSQWTLRLDAKCHSLTSTYSQLKRLCSVAYQDRYTISEHWFHWWPFYIAFFNEHWGGKKKIRHGYLKPSTNILCRGQSLHNMWLEKMAKNGKEKTAGVKIH